MSALESIGTLYAIQDLAEDLKVRSIDISQFITGFKEYGVSTSNDIIETGTRLSWLAVSPENLLILTTAGARACTGSTRSEKLRNQLASLIATEKPPWAALLPKGRDETYDFLPTVIQQCFREAGIMDDLTDEVTAWWDKLANIARGDLDAKLLEIGRRGERLSIAHELSRTGKKPQWIALDTNLAGYDLLSTMGPKDATRLKIEVKATTASPDFAEIHISEHEWSVASLSPHDYLFHIWQLHPQPQLFTATVKKISSHISSNRGSGHWEAVRMPLKALTPSKRQAIHTALPKRQSSPHSAR